MTDENKVAETVSADEKVDGGAAGVAGAAGSAGTTPSPKRGRRKVTAVVATVAVVLVAAGAGFMVWHDQPSFCNAICHTPMDGYLTTYESTPGEAATDKWGNQVADASSMLAPVHAQEGITCVGCHVPQMSEQVTEGFGWLTGSYSVVQTVDERFVPEEKSLSDLTEARGIASGKPTAVKGLKKKDGSTFDAKLVLGPKPYSGWAELAPREAKPKKPTARKGASSKPFGRRGR